MIVKYLYVYILKCADGVYYTGLTNNPEKRLIQHNTGVNKEAFTYTRRPVEMVYCEYFTDYLLAIKWEKWVKDWSKKKKEALIARNWETLQEYAACRNKSSHSLLDSARSDRTSARSDSASARNDRTSARSDNASAQSDSASEK